MTPLEIRSIIKLATDACMNQNSQTFASLFRNDAEMILPGYRLLGKAQIQAATSTYLQSCDEIKIEIQRILVEGDRAVVEWIWQACKNGKSDYAENAIIIDFKAGLIRRWREYTDPHAKNATSVGKEE
ncbi:MAG: nuclear transport factor 2 family protein [Jaaginema sp. PMC 1079.18]|nr:nuclear transport factor 2 family protein [Jaaginema sp. PMC 1080.18]MEC4853513.1 nuclear transport factor 2 family protein [Jaaginema sp. PMC 1079.18]MEC4867849.1 nuclear transport factor 2 family protein [Jaaginema sp. PMC 1078.18]